MACKKIIWSARAGEELREVLDYYIFRNGNANYSLKLLYQVQDLLRTLSNSELIGRLTSNDITRVIPLDVYLIFYEVHNDQIQIIAFWDNRQDPEKRTVK